MMNLFSGRCSIFLLSLVSCTFYDANGFLHQSNSIIPFCHQKQDTFGYGGTTTEENFGSDRLHRWELYSSRVTGGEIRRKELLSRNGPYFKYNRFQSNIEFGSTAKLNTKLVEENSSTLSSKEKNYDLICQWLTNEREIALSIWDSDKMKDLGDKVFRLEVMKLQFVTLTLQPWVDMKMYTEYEEDAKKKKVPVFKLESVGFDPNVFILPGVGFKASDMGIIIEVAGELRPSKDGSGVTGTITFQTAGKMPPPFLMVPDQALKLATDTINKTIVNFASKSFEKGAKKQFNDFKVENN